MTDPEPMDDRRAVEIVCAIARTLPGWDAPGPLAPVIVASAIETHAP